MFITTSLNIQSSPSLPVFRQRPKHSFSVNHFPTSCYDNPGLAPVIGKLSWNFESTVLAVLAAPKIQINTNIVIKLSFLKSLSPQKRKRVLKWETRTLNS